MRTTWIFTTILALLGIALSTNQEDENLSIGEEEMSCDSPYFSMSAENLEASESDKFYRDLIRDITKHSPEDYSRMGEVSAFAYHALKKLDVRCSSYNQGCIGIPACDNVLERVPNRDGKKDIARKLYFSMKKIESIVNALVWFQVSSEPSALSYTTD